jgi:hypothetical protein
VYPNKALKYHCPVQDDTLLHWLFPRKDLKNGPCVLVDDKACLEMFDAIVTKRVAEICKWRHISRYCHIDADNEASDYEDQLEAMDDP